MFLRFRTFQLASLVTLVIAAGCGQRKPAAHPLPQNPLVSKCAPGIPGGKLVLAAPFPKTFNPLAVNDNGSDAIVRLLIGSLVYVDLVTQQGSPGLAESWSVEPDQKTWTFKLRKGLHWSDGAPLTAEDVAFTWNRIMYNQQPNRMMVELFRINGKPFAVTNLDELTVRVVTPDVYAPFLEYFGGVPILPKHALEAAVDAKVFPSAFGIGMKPDRIVSCGPYRIKAVEAGRSTLLERNPEYWVTDKTGRRLPYFDEILVLAAANLGTEAMLFLNGKTAAFEQLRSENYDQFREASAGGRFKLLDLGIGTERDFLWFNQNTGTNALGKPIVAPAKLKWFRNRKFRQAVSCAIDRDRLAREVYGGHAQPIYGFISSENDKWNNPNVPKYGYSVERARALLAEAGLQDRNGDGVVEDSDGVPAEIVFNTNSGNPVREKAAALLRQDLAKVGIKLDFQPVDFDVLLRKINETFDYECAFMGLGGGGADPASQMNVLKSNEDLHQWFPRQQTPSTEWEARIDSLMEQQMRTLDFAQRKKLFDEVQSILAEEMPMIYTVAPRYYAAIRPDIENLRPSALSPYRLTWNIEELYFGRH